MPRGQDIRDYLEILGGQIGRSGIARQPYQSPVAVGLESALSGFASGSAGRRSLEEGRRMRAAKEAFGQKVGLSFDLFSKLSSEAQEEILRSSGAIEDPTRTALPDFGGRSLRQLEYEGIPGPTEVGAPSAIFEGAPSAEVQTGPGLPPLALFGKSGASRAAAVNTYLGAEPELDPSKQSLIDYRKSRLEQFERDLQGRGTLRKTQEDRNRAAIRAMKVLTAKREKPDEPIETWEADVGRSMGLMIPKGVTPTRTQFNGLLKFNRPAMAVVSRITDLALAARQAEIAAGRTLSDKELATVIGQQTTELPALAGPNAAGIVLQGVKAQLEAMRKAPDLFFTPAAEEGEEGEEGADVPGEFEDEDDVEEEETDDDLR